MNGERYHCPSLTSGVLAVIFLVSAVCLIGCGASRQGCSSTDPGHCEAIIPGDTLPPGWRMMDSSEMPPIDKTPWWHRNPQSLKGRETRVLDEEIWSTTASQVWAVIYAKAYERVVMFCYTYSSAHDARIAYAHLQRESSPDNTLLGVSRKDKNTIIFMSLPAKCPDRDFFVRHFAAVACPPEDPKS